MVTGQQLKKRDNVAAYYLEEDTSVMVYEPGHVMDFPISQVREDMVVWSYNNETGRLFMQKGLKVELLGLRRVYCLLSGTRDGSGNKGFVVGSKHNLVRLKQEWLPVESLPEDSEIIVEDNYSDLPDLTAVSKKEVYKYQGFAQCYGFSFPQKYSIKNIVAGGMAIATN